MGELKVTVIEGRNIKKMDLFSESDPFVELYLDDDDEEEKQKTTVKRNSKNPQWNEIFVLNHVEGQDILHIDVYDKNLIINAKISSLAIDLREVYTINHIDNWYNLPDRTQAASNGEIHLMLDYEPLHI